MNPPGEGIPAGLPGDVTGVVEVLIRDKGVTRVAMILSSPSETPLAGTPLVNALASGSDGVVGNELEIKAFPSSESASKSSGGRRSFSISDFRLKKI